MHRPSGHHRHNSQTLRAMLSDAQLAHLATAYAPVTVVRRLAVGGTAELWLCQTSEAQSVVVKTALDPARHRPLLAHEARVLAAVTHPRVVPCLAVADAALVLPFLPGCSLGAIMDGMRRRGRRLPTGAIAALLAEIGAGLHAVHAAGFAHGDLNPNNIMIDPAGLPVLIDLGLAVALSAQASTVLGAAGTLAFMAPEQLEGRPVGAPTDVYALGLITYALLAGTDWLPPGAASIGALLAARRRVPPPVPGVSAALNGILLAMLQPAAADRPSLAEALSSLAAALPAPDSTALADWANRSQAAPTVQTVQPVVTIAAPVQQTRRWGWWGVALLLCGGAVGWWATRAPGEVVAEAPAIVVAPASRSTPSRSTPSLSTTAPRTTPPPQAPKTAVPASMAPATAAIAPPSARAAAAPTRQARPPRTAKRPAKQAIEVRGLGGQIMIAVSGTERFAPWTTWMSAQRDRITARLHGPNVSATLYLRWVDDTVHMRVRPMPFSTTRCPSTSTRLPKEGQRCQVRLGEDTLAFEVRPR